MSQEFNTSRIRQAINCYSGGGALLFFIQFADQPVPGRNNQRHVTRGFQLAGQPNRRIIIGGETLVAEKKPAGDLAFVWGRNLTCVREPADPAPAARNPAAIDGDWAPPPPGARSLP